MSEQPVTVSADDLHAASQQAAVWDDAVRRAARGETVAVIAHGEHVADTDFMAVDARARYARDPARYERGMTKLLKATTMDTGR